MATTVTIMVPRTIIVDGCYCDEGCPLHAGCIDSCSEFKEDGGLSQLLDREHYPDGRWLRCDECLAAEKTATGS